MVFRQSPLLSLATHARSRRGSCVPQRPQDGARSAFAAGAVGDHPLQFRSHALELLDPLMDVCQVRTRHCIDVAAGQFRIVIQA